MGPSRRRGGRRAWWLGRFRISTWRGRLNTVVAGALSAGLVAFVALVWPGGCGHHAPPPPPSLGEAPILRIRIVQDAQQVKLTCAQPPTVRAGGGTPRQLDIPANATAPITFSRGAWQIGAATIEPDGPAGAPNDLVIDPAAEGSVKVEGNAYRGSLRLVPVGAAGRFEVINHVPVEGYLKGVLAREMWPEFHPEAYAAQAIVARTYALYEQRMVPAGRSWDLHADTRSQMYGGMKGETEKSRRATDATAGVVVAHGPAGQERIFKAYFSSCCGGIGQSGADAFGEAPTEPLSDRSVGHQCADPANKRFSWGPIVVSRDELTRRYRLWGKNRGRPERDMGRVERLEVFKSNASGRPTHFVITDARGARYLMVGEELRWATNTDAPDSSELYSSYVTPVVDGNNVRFENGHGFGHGVGMCQWCAEAQAKRGVGHEQIVVEAYKGSKLVRAY